MTRKYLTGTRAAVLDLLGGSAIQNQEELVRVYRDAADRATDPDSKEYWRKLALEETRRLMDFRRIRNTLK